MERSFDWYTTHHVPYVVWQPVDDRIHPADKLQVLGFGWSFSNKKHDKAGWYKWHGNDDKYGDHKIYALTPNSKSETQHQLCLQGLNAMKYI